MSRARCPAFQIALPTGVRGFPQADGEERHPRFHHRIDVRDQGRQRHPGGLGGEGRGKGEDVGDDDRRVEPLDQRQQGPRRVGGVAAFVGVGLGRREGLVFLGGGEGEPGALDRGRRSSQVSTVTSWPRRASARPSEIAG